MTQTIDRSRYRRLLNQAFEECKELQRLEDIIFKVRQLATIKRAKVKELEAQAEELERARLMTNATKNPSKKKINKISLESIKDILSPEELKSLLKGGTS